MDSIDISSIRVWKLTLIPFGAGDRNGDHVRILQERCRKAGIAPLGFWVGNRYSELESEINAANLVFEKNTPLNKENREKYSKIYEKACNLEEDDNHIFTEKKQNRYEINKDKSLETALDYMESIKPNDYIIMRHRDGNYYIGKVKSEKAIFLGGNKDIGEHCNNISWGVEVEKFIGFTEEKIPSEISGRFSQRNQRTLSPIRSARIRMLIEKLYMSIEHPNDPCNIPKINITLDNFSNSLNYKELEDLVALYIHEKHRDYCLLPSSGKINRVKYEFSFFCEGKKPITCQVKNCAPVNPADYIEDSKHYETIYLFSGIWNDDYYSEYKNLETNNIIMIPRKDLYDLMKDNKYFLLLGKDTEVYYEYVENSKPFNLSNYFTENGKLKVDEKEYYIEKRKEKAKWITNDCIRYQISNDNDSNEGAEEEDQFDSNFYISIGHNCLYYSPEFNRLIIDVNNEVKTNIVEAIKDYFKNI